jgi:hypothetical protein
MLKLVVNNKEEDEELPQPRLQTDWMGPKDGDWLSPMKSGTEFLVRSKTGELPRWLLHEFTHGGKIHGNVLLCPTSTLNDVRTWKWVDPTEFCKSFELRGILEVPENDNQP